MSFKNSSTLGIYKSGQQYEAKITVNKRQEKLGRSERYACMKCFAQKVRNGETRELQKLKYNDLLKYKSV